MKKSILGGFIGLSIVISIETIARITLSLYMDYDFQAISYSEFPGILWPVLLVAIAGFSSLLGGIFALSYGKEHRASALLTFLFLLSSLRYAQVHLLFETDPFYSISALIVSLFVLILAWKLTTPKQLKEKLNDDFNQTHHHPEKHGS